ncbi:MAG: hypothetical protein AB7O98_03825 [Hyphomonadaceae bacterium]
MRMRRRLAGAAIVATAVFAPFASAQDASQAQELANCAGAVAAIGGFDVLSFPRGAEGEWAPVMTAILAALNREPGVEGMSGRYAASAAREFWSEQPPTELDAAAQACRTRYGSN